MPPVPTPRQSGSVVARDTGAVDKRSPGSIEYVDTEGVGFELLPELIRRSVGSTLIGEEIAAAADRPKTRRRRDGSHYQFASGWWASTERLVVIEGRRALERREGNQFVPAAAWNVLTVVRQFPPGLVDERSRWHFDAEAGSSRGACATKAVDPLEVLPPPLTAPVCGGQSSAWQQYWRGGGWALETIVALRMSKDRVRVLKAEREAGSLRALATADWRAITLDAPIVETRTLAGDQDHARLDRRSTGK